MKMFKLLDEMSKITLKDGSSFASSEDAAIELKKKGMSAGEIAAKLNTTVASVSSILAAVNRRTVEPIKHEPSGKDTVKSAEDDANFIEAAKKAEREIVKIVNKLGLAAVRKLGGTIIGNDENFLSTFNRKESPEHLYLSASISVSRLGEWELSDDSDPYADYILTQESKKKLAVICNSISGETKENKIVGNFIKAYGINCKVEFETHEKRIVELSIILRNHK